MQIDRGREGIVRGIARPVRRAGRILLSPFRLAWRTIQGLAELFAPVFEVLEAIAKLGCIALPLAFLALAACARRAADRNFRPTG